MSDKVVANPMEAMEAKMNEMLVATQAKVTEMLERATVRAKAIIDDANVVVRTTTTPAAPRPKERKMVEVKLFKDDGAYKDDVFIGVNCTSFMVQRGVRVMVPDYVAEILEGSIKQAERAANRLQRFADEYEKATKERAN